MKFIYLVKYGLIDKDDVSSILKSNTYTDAYDVYFKSRPQILTIDKETYLHLLDVLYEVIPLSS